MRQMTDIAKKLAGDERAGALAGRGLVTPRDTMQTLPSSLRDIDEPFAAGNLNLRRLGPPPADEAGVVLFDLRESQAFERAVIELAYACFNGHRQIVFLADEPRGVARAF